MFSNVILDFFRIRSSGDEGDTGSGDQGAGAADKGGNSGDQGSGNDDDQGGAKKFDISSLPDEAQKMLKDLRAENAKHRTSNNNLSSEMDKLKSGFKKMFGEGEDDVDPSEKLEALQGNYESAVTRSAVLELALENGISGKENVEYFEFLMTKAMSNLKEGEELTQEDLESIVDQSNPSKGAATTGTKNDNKGDKKPDVDPTETTQEEFNKMGMTQKSMLYRTKPELYNKLLKGASL